MLLFVEGAGLVGVCVDDIFASVIINIFKLI
jgi:hypothetical protein